MEDRTWGELINNFVDITIEIQETKIASKQFANLVFPKIGQVIQEEINIRLCAANKLIDLYNRSWNNNEDID
ncbi:MAG: hypothetical protein WBA41_28340, partial [Rivularia sp. (in: cyanobacteria)]